MTNTIYERIKPVLSEIIKVIYAEKADQYRLELTKLAEPYKGWIDGFQQVPIPESYREEVRSHGGIETRFVDRYYYTIFDLEDSNGKKLRKKFWESTKDEVVYDFNPTPSFRVKGVLHKHRVVNNLEWVVLATIE